MQNCEVIRLDSIDEISEARKRIAISLVNNSPTIFLLRLPFHLSMTCKISKGSITQNSKNLLLKFVDYQKTIY